MTAAAFMVSRKAAMDWVDGLLTDTELVRTQGDTLFVLHVDCRRALFKLLHTFHPRPRRLVWRATCVDVLLFRKATHVCVDPNGNGEWRGWIDWPPPPMERLT